MDDVFRHVYDLPHTWTFALTQRMFYDSLLELPEQLPQEHWDYPHIVRRHIDRIYGKKKETEIDIEELNE